MNVFHNICIWLFHVLMVFAPPPSAKLASERHGGVSNLPEGLNEDSDLDSSTVSSMIVGTANLSFFREKIYV